MNGWETSACGGANPSFGGSVKTRPASAARPLLPYRTRPLLPASLFQGVASDMNDSFARRFNKSGEIDSGLVAGCGDGLR